MRWKAVNLINVTFSKSLLPNDKHMIQATSQTNKSTHIIMEHIIQKSELLNSNKTFPQISWKSNKCQINDNKQIDAAATYNLINVTSELLT